MPRIYEEGKYGNNVVYAISTPVREARDPSEDWIWWTAFIVGMLAGSTVRDLRAEKGQPPFIKVGVLATP